MKKILELLLFVAVMLATAAVHAQGTAFAYQGRLESNGTPANGNYDLAFTLYATNTGGIAVAGPVTYAATAVSNGLFAVTIDFGAGVFAGNNYWLDISVSPSGSNAFVELTPRQPILPTPYAIMANSASNLLGMLPSSQLTGTIPATQLPPAIVTNMETGLTLGGAFSGNGSGLTALNPASLGAGTAAINISGNAATATSTTTATSASTAASATTAATANTAELASNVVSGINISNAYVTNSTFAGNGGSLTNLNPANLRAGTAAINISGNAATATSAITATTANTAELASNVVTGINITNAYITNSIFAGNGGGLTNLSASQLIGSVPGASLTSVPAGNLTGTVPLAQLPPTVVTNTQTGVTLSGTFTGVFTVVTNLVVTNLTAASISTNGSTAGQVLTSSGGVTKWANANPWLGGVPTLVTNGVLSTNAVLMGHDRAFFLGFITSAAFQQTYSNYFTIKLSQAVSTNAVIATFAPGAWGSWTNSGYADSASSFGAGTFQFVTTSNSVTVQSAGRTPDSSISFGIFVHVDQP
jgi:hypothetical protein